MSANKCCQIIIFVLLVYQINFLESARGGGGRRGGSSGGGSSRPSRPHITSRPYPAPTSRPATNRPFPSHTTSRSHTTNRPFPSQSTFRSYPSQATQRPIPSHTTYRPSQSNQYTTRRAPYPTQLTTARRPQGPDPNYSNAGWSRPGSNQQSVVNRPVYVQPPGGNTKVKINVHNYHSPNYFAPPSYPVYHYSSRDTGSGTLGFFLGYSLARLTTPSYRVGYGYAPVYDHYTVHHYNHNRETVPQRQVVQQNNIVVCGGDVPNICPQGTYALCTGSGQIMCVASAVNTVTCKDNPNLKCVEATVPCTENNQDPKCKVNHQQNVTVSVPCISTAEVNGNVHVVNNTIVSEQNLTSNATVTTTSAPIQPYQPGITTTPPPFARAKRQIQNQYCVTVLAEPSVRKPTEGEEVLNEIEGSVGKFFEKAFGLS